MSDTGNLTVRVLGPLEVSISDTPARLGHLERLLLAALVANRGRVVSADRLIESLWAQTPPASARNRIQALVSGLRRAIDPEAAAVRTQPPGYRLHLPLDNVDSSRFDQAIRDARARVAQNDPTGALRLFDDGLAIWRGNAYDGAASPLVSAEIARLEELRGTALEEQFDLRLALGDPYAVVADLFGLLAAHPLRQRLRGQLMIALYRTDRQAEALGVYRTGATLLAEEHGLSPGEELQRLHRAILVEDPSLARAEVTGSTAVAIGAATPGGSAVNGSAAHSAHHDPASHRHEVVPAQLPAGVAAFTGRADHLRTLDAFLDDDGRSVRTMVTALISGAGGVGKTALALHWAHAVRHRFADGQLYVNLRGYAPAGAAMDAGDALRGFLRALGVAPASIPAELDAQAGLYRSLLSDRRVLVVLDNARDAEQVRPLLPGAPGCVVVVTSRSRLAGLVAADGARPLAVDVLEPAEAQQLLCRRLGAERVAAESHAIDEIIARCAGLPLALVIVAARVATNPRSALAALAGELREARSSLDVFASQDVTTDVRAVFSWSYDALSIAAARAFRLFGLHPAGDISAPAIASLAAISMPAARAILAELTGAHLLTEHFPGRYTAHDLLRAYTTELVNVVDLDRERQAASERLVCHYLHTAHAATLMLNRRRDPIALLAVPAGTTPEQIVDAAEATAWFTAERDTLLATVERAAEQGFDQLAWQLAWTLETFLSRRGFWHAWRHSQTTALTAARRLDDRTAEARSHRGIGDANIQLGNDVEALPHLLAGLAIFAALGDHAGAAHTHHNLARVYERQANNAKVLQHSQQALDLYRLAGHVHGQARSLNGIGWYHALHGDYRQALVCCESALTLFREIGECRDEADAWDSLGYIHHHLGDHPRAASCYQRALELLREAGDRLAEAVTLTRLGNSYAAVAPAAAAPAAADGDGDGDGSNDGVGSDGSDDVGVRDGSCGGEAREVWQAALAILDELRHPDAAAVREKLQRSSVAARPPDSIEF